MLTMPKGVNLHLSALSFPLFLAKPIAFDLQIGFDPHKLTLGR
jgi:hypothetical protein